MVSLSLSLYIIYIIYINIFEHVYIEYICIYIYNVRTGLITPLHHKIQKVFTRSEVVPTSLKKETSRPEDNYNYII